MIKFDFQNTKLPVRDFDSMLVLLLTVSIFAPFYFSVAVTCAIAIMTMMNCKKRTKAFSFPYSKYLLGFLIIPFFVSATYNNYWGMLYAIVILAAATCGFYIRSVMTRQLFDQVMDVSCIASIWCALVAIFQKITAYGDAPRYRPVSAFHNANCYGMMIEFIIIIAIYRIFTKAKNKNFYLGVIGINLVGLYLSASLSAFLATACAIMTVLLFKKRYRLAGGLVLLAVAFLSVSLVFPSIFPRGLEAIDSTCGQRISIWTTAVRGIVRHPFLGTGALSYQMICEQLGGYKTYHCHNLLLDTLLNFGFIGFGAIGVYVAMQLKLLSLRFRSNLGKDMNILVLAAVVAIAVHGMTDVTIFWIQTGMLFLLMFSATGIGAEHLERKLRLPSLIPDYAEDVKVQPVYLKN
ncbi:O-antigen ligase family protein [Caproiciproducens faecalis]|uniref:O-antigen ligase family protein n=1 Tax=Caproiciproducens faecalis TaxID=2820301 RepID=A0ABS7DQD4_9FIRM|nr:O-antigen ligase family protein [Caproiciproducens faecalis]MBW7573517.1 O-antigen ligase family protein [Caproiciproducens faecalis]